VPQVKAWCCKESANRSLADGSEDAVVIGLFFLHLTLADVIGQEISKTSRGHFGFVWGVDEGMSIFIQ